MNKKKRLIILAPNDRYNYGDLLFSHIIKFQLSDLYDNVVNVSTISNDLTKVGGDVVKPLSTIYSLSDDFENHIIIAGGESFFSEWYYAVSYLDKEFKKKTDLIVKILNKIRLQSIYFKISFLYAKYSLKATTEFPYTIGKNEIANVGRIFCNSLGASDLSPSFIGRGNVNNILKNIDYISLRDINSHNILNSMGVENYLVPDCAIIMSEYYTNNFLENKIKANVDSFVKNNVNQYIVFQINKTLGEKYFDQIIDFFKHLTQEKHQLKICLCPIGFALGHEDQIILRRIHNKLSEMGIYTFFSEELAIWDIMYLISNSKAFIGTSLHGVISAMSFKRPYLGILVKKTINYINKWGVKDVCMISHNLEILSTIEILLSNNDIKSKMETSYLYQKKIVLESFNRIRVLTNL